jgi:hypothetical protein
LLDLIFLRVKDPRSFAAHGVALSSPAARTHARVAPIATPPAIIAAMADVLEAGRALPVVDESIIWGPLCDDGIVAATAAYMPHHSAVAAVPNTSPALIDVASYQTGPAFRFSLTQAAQELYIKNGLAEYSVNCKIHALLKLGTAVKRQDYLDVRVDDQPLPNLAMGYCVGLLGPANVIEPELDRVLVRGENLSLMTGKPLPLGYKLMLQDAERMVRALVLSGKGDACVLFGYAGQENRDIASPGWHGRMWDHFTAYGNCNLSELLCYTTPRSRDGHRIHAFGKAADWPVLRFVASYLPRTQAVIDVFEAILGVVVAFGRGAISACNSMTGDGDRRFLDAGRSGSPPHLLTTLTEIRAKFTWLRLSRMSPEDVPDAMLRRVLRLHSRFLASGLCLLADGTSPKPLLECKGRVLFSAWQTVLVTVQDADAGMLASREVHPWAGRCTCAPSRLRSPCWCVVLGRAFYIDNVNTAKLAINPSAALAQYGLSVRANVVLRRWPVAPPAQHLYHVIPVAPQLQHLQQFQPMTKYK